MCDCRRFSDWDKVTQSCKNMMTYRISILGWTLIHLSYIHLNELLGEASGRNVFDQYLEKSQLKDGRSGYKCTMCGKENSHVNNVRNHVESVHFPGHFSYDCEHCGKTFKSKNSLCNHVSKSHRWTIKFVVSFQRPYHFPFNLLIKTKNKSLHRGGVHFFFFFFFLAVKKNFF